MNTGSINNPNNIHLVAPPKAEWMWTFEGQVRFNTVKAPNRFHRFMQRIFLGIIWRKL